MKKLLLVLVIIPRGSVLASPLLPSAFLAYSCPGCIVVHTVEVQGEILCCIVFETNISALLSDSTCRNKQSERRRLSNYRFL